MRALLYLLAAGLFQQPGASRIAALRGIMARLLEQPPGALSPWRLLLTDLAGHLWLPAPALPSDYNRLFVLAVPQVAAQPFGSYWLEGRLMGRTTEEVEQLMAAFGVAPSGGLLPDHIAAELEFMGWLIANEEAEDTAAVQHLLLHEHLARWVPAFVAALRAGEPPRQYALAATLLDRLLSDHLANPLARDEPAEFPIAIPQERFE